jgi:SAM-dependent methyltransferase
MTDFQYDGRDLELSSFEKNYHKWILSVFRPYLGERVAEVGAGSGNFSELLLEEPVKELFAIEPSKEMIDRLIARAGGDARVHARNDFFTNVSADYTNYFDSVVYVNVLEHIEDHTGELARVYESLKPGGHVCIFVPALKWLYSEHDKAIGHHRRYYKKELVELVLGAGFTVVKARYFNLAAVLPWLVVFKWLKRTPKSGTISVYDNYVVPISRVFESVIPLPFGNNLILVGKKK